MQSQKCTNIECTYGRGLHNCRHQPVSWVSWVSKVRSYYAAIALCCRTALSRNCHVTALRGCIKVKFILTWNLVMLWWLAAGSNQYISTATQPNVSMNRPLHQQPNTSLPHSGATERHKGYYVLPSFNLTLLRSWVVYALVKQFWLKSKYFRRYSNLLTFFPIRTRTGGCKWKFRL